MSLVAVVTRSGDREGDVPRTVVVPVGMPQDTEIGGYFESGATSLMPAGSSSESLETIMGFQFMARSKTPQSSLIKTSIANIGARILGASRREMGRALAAEDVLLKLAAALESDGGLPGSSDAARLDNSLAAFLYFQQTGSTRTSGPFRAHATRLWQFLESHGDDKIRRIADHEKTGADWLPHVLRMIREGTVDSTSFQSDLDAHYRNWGQRGNSQG